MTFAFYALLIIAIGAVLYWSGYIAGKRQGKIEELHLIKQTSADLCRRCGWRFSVPGVLGKGTNGCYNCDCEKIVSYRQSDEFASIGKR